ncbi:hypothetical protein BE18_28250, partial [Sorangium cellulosum]
MSNNDVDSGTGALSGANDALRAGRAGAEGAAGAAGTMKMASASSTAGSTGVAFAEALAALRAGLGGEPDHLFLSYTEGHDLGELARATAAL